MTARGVCGIWRFRRRFSIRRATVKESTTFTFTPMGLWLLQGKVDTAPQLAHSQKITE